MAASSIFQRLRRRGRVFVLSGFVLARSLDANRDPVRFFRNRVFRLFPAAIFTVSLITVLHSQFGFDLDPASFDPIKVGLNFLLIKSDINRVMWSMTVECFATPLIFLSVLLVHKKLEPALWALVAVLFCLSPIGQYAHLLGGYTGAKPEQIERAIADDLAFLAAHPVCRGTNSETIARRREFKEAMRRHIRDIAASRDLSGEEIKPALRLRHEEITRFTEAHGVNLEWLLEGKRQIFKSGAPS